MTDTRRPVPSQQKRPAQPLQPSRLESPADRWVDLREAEELTGIPASTIRNWARKHRIDSRFEMDESGDRRYVEIGEVVAWADHLGRQHKRVVREEDVASRQSPVPSEDEVANRETEVANDSPIHDSIIADRVKAADTEPPEEADRSRDYVEYRESQVADEGNHDEQLAIRDVPEGTMLVPLDAWNKMLNQLGNLHEAGQQLADARERAAKAETEVQFLRERLAELRKQPATYAAESDVAELPASGGEDPIDPLWVDLYRRWRRRRT